MKATGIVRRIDDLGRVVIPKEIRRTMRIKEGDPLEIYVDREGEVILKKYSPITSLSDFAREYADALSNSIHTTVLIADRDEVIAVSGGSKKEFLHQRIGSIVEKVMEDRRTLVVNRIHEEVNKKAFSILDSEEENDMECFCIAPVIPGGDVIGAVLICSKEKGVVMGDLEQKLAETAAGFLAKQLEQ
ncbi:MAG TPA: stage V sporulation protein T [Clostridiales bacterium]|nr:stage V sporulation protein T [Clostridiales bacterium]